jgi:TIR domain
MPKRIFISYRRSDTQMAAGRFRDALVGRFGAASVFRDKEAIRPGHDWVDEIRRALEGDVVVLALVGPQWANSQDAEGRRRLDDPEDTARYQTGGVSTGRCTGAVTADGSRINGSCTDTLLGTIPVNVMRQ